MSAKQKIMVVMGTRPEAIKLFPLVHLLKETPGVDASVCVTAQHRDMLDQMLAFADIIPDYDLDLMQAGQSLEGLSARIMLEVSAVLREARPDRVVVQGDTTTAMMSALAAFYHRIPVSHVEAGLRSGDITSPFPEEANRKIVGQIAHQHFAPTPRAAKALRAEGVSHDRIMTTGNTVVDALLAARAKIASEPRWRGRKDTFAAMTGGRRAVLATCHRRENFGRGIENVADALAEIAARGDVHILMPVHPNPNVGAIFKTRLGDHPYVSLLPPLDYVDFVSALDHAELILTDSGGVQEEAPALGKPVLVLRDNTERPEAVEAGTALLVGTNRHTIVEEAARLLDDKAHYHSMATAHNPFGDGFASERILGALLDDRRISDYQYSWTGVYRPADGSAHSQPRIEGDRRRYQRDGDVVDHGRLDEHQGAGA
ncbi:non-hydrolyzing UDP-N-acetylglucosamine 2-epimerase [Aliihoeflea sp. PC F10.4]